MPVRLTLACFACLVTSCAPLAAQHQADAAFRKALAAQLARQEDQAENGYREVLALGFEWSPVLNNLAVIAVHRHEYIAARKLLQRAVAANDRDLVALTNYGVMSFYLSDLSEARRSLVDAQALRRDLLNHMPTMGRNDYAHDHYEHVTQSLAQTAEKFIRRIDEARHLGAEALPPSESIGDAQAALALHRL
jgi:Tfp pilus assembly protein PilF